MDIDLNKTYWDRLKGFVSEHRVDARWVLRENDTERPLGSLRIVSHPDLSPGFLRAHFTFMTSIREKSKEEKLQTIEVVSFTGSTIQKSVFMEKNLNGFRANAINTSSLLIFFLCR